MLKGRLIKNTYQVNQRFLAQKENFKIVLKKLIYKLSYQCEQASFSVIIGAMLLQVSYNLKITLTTSSQEKMYLIWSYSSNNRYLQFGVLFSAFLSLMSL